MTEVEIPTQVTISNPLTLLQSALERGLEPDRLGRLIDLVEHWQANRAREEYNRSMVAAQKAMPKVHKDAKNAFLKTRYASAENIQELCKPIWLEHGFALSFTEVPEDASDMICMRCDVRHQSGHVESLFARYPRDGAGMKGEKNMNPLQGTVSAHSYAERDMTTLIFNIIVAGTDKDGNTSNPTISEEQVKELEDLIGACAAAKRPVDDARFSKYLSEITGITPPDGKFVALNQLNQEAYLTVKGFLLQRAKGK
jgi:hypothetical protein